MEIKFGKLIECIAISPNLNLSWVKFSKGTIYYIQFAWLFWYITFATKKVKL